MNTNDVYITRIAAFLPGAPVDNQDMETLIGKVGGLPSKARQIVLRSNRIKSRHYAVDPQTLLPTHNNAQLTAEAVRRLAGDGFSVNDIQCLASGTSMPDQTMPNHAVMVQGELGIPPCEVVATSGVCVCGMTAMKYAYLAIKSGEYKNAVATGSELASGIMHARHYDIEHQDKVEELTRHPEIAFEKDFLRWMLSDGAGAVLLEPKPKAGSRAFKIEWIEIRSYANEMEACMYAGAEKIDGRLKSWLLYNQEERSKLSVMAVKQDVKLLNSNIIEYTVVKPLSEFIQSKQLKQTEIDWFVPHYSSDYFREKVYDGLKKAGFEIPYEKWFTNLTEKGNTGCASIYIMLDEMLNTGKVKVGERLLCYVPESGRFSSCFMMLTVV